MKTDPYSTHMKALVDHLVPGDSVIEFGCGLYSTPFFCAHARQVVSIEMQDERWMEKVKADLRSRQLDKNHFPVLRIGAWDFMSVNYAYYGPFDLALVDGHKESRWACVNLMMQLGVKTIVAHDSEAGLYRWDKVIGHFDYSSIDYEEDKPNTKVWVRNSS